MAARDRDLLWGEEHGCDCKGYQQDPLEHFDYGGVDVIELDKLSIHTHSHTHVSISNTGEV